MRKIFSVIALAISFSVAPVQAQSDFDFNKNFQPLSVVYDGVVVGVSTYLIVREKPDVNSREVLRIYNGDKICMRAMGGNWYELLSVNGNYYGVSPGDIIGYVSKKYIKNTTPNLYAPR